MAASLALRRSSSLFRNLLNSNAPRTTSVAPRLLIAGEGEDGRRYSSRIELPQNVYKVDEIKAEMTNGVLKVRVPKVKEEERKDVFQVKIE
ncbi:heat shock 22 kDa protein, mitochondrial [Daucus carota subsp. sativus]|uniref:heat shock 22 kDa protein, mitochondrial n=1 Tax=Daucus carota subsp. sativus TaxID=79200 RepID=UPI00308334BD